MQFENQHSRQGLGYVLIIIAFIYFIFQIGCGKEGFLPEVSGKTWIQIHPIQCGGNPWEIDYLEKNGSPFPRTNHSDNEISQEEIEVIKNYYNLQGTYIYDVKSKKVYDVICLACDCPRFYVICLLVDDTDVGKMLELGFTIAEE